MSFILTPEGRRPLLTEEVIEESMKGNHLYGDFPLTMHSMNNVGADEMPRSEQKVPEHLVGHMYNSEHSLKNKKFDKNKINKHWDKYYEHYENGDPDAAEAHYDKFPDHHKKLIDHHVHGTDI